MGNAGPARRAKTKPHRSGRERKGWIILTGGICLLAMFISLAMAMDFTTLLSFHASSKREIQSAKLAPARTGVIVLETGDNRCEFRKFDNDTGRMIVEKIQRCNETLKLDRHGVPVPMGTVHRLDAISKSIGNAH
jgi:hypothetical protein